MGYMRHKDIYLITGVFEKKTVVFLKNSIGSYLEANIPLHNATELASFLKKYRKLLRIYKTRRGAEEFISKLKSQYKIPNDFLTEVVCITGEMRSPAFTGCPKCQSLEVVGTYSVEYHRFIRFDVEEKSALCGNSEMSDSGSVERYSCAKCGCDLSEYKINDYVFKNTDDF